MSRGTAADLPVVAPIVRELPAIYHDDSFIAEFTSGLDAVLAPAMVTLDSLDAYIDPSVAPSDFVNWLATWIGVSLDEDWTIERRRAFVTAADEMFGRRGTAHGLRDEVAMYTDGTVTVHDPGETITASAPTGGPDGSSASAGADRTVRVTVDVVDHETVNWAGLQAVVRDAVPAHLPVEVDLREGAAT